MKQNRDTQIGERAKAIVRARQVNETLEKLRTPTKKVTLPSPDKPMRSTLKEKVTLPSPDKPMRSKRPRIKEPVTGGSDTVPATSERNEFRKELAKRNATPGMAKGGKMASYGMKKGGKATKFGAAMKKKSADTKGRAMMKFAKGGSIDGCAVKGKTKASMVKMKNGGSC